MTTVLVQGGNAALTQRQVAVSLKLEGVPYDVAALGIKNDGKIYAPNGQEWLALFSQTHTPEGALSLSSNNSFTVNLDLVPPEVSKLVFVASLPEGEVGKAPLLSQGTFSVAPAHQAALPPLATYTMMKKDLGGKETSLILGEMYRRGSDWKVRAVGQGFNNGFAALLESYGIVIETPPTTPPTDSFKPLAAAPPKRGLQEDRLISLEKKAPPLVHLAKTAYASLKTAELGDLPAMEVYAVIDTSISMEKLYSTGVVQNVAERLLAVAALLDDDGSVPLIRFDRKAHLLKPINLDNFPGHLQREVRDFVPDTRYAPAMQLVLQHGTDKWVDVAGKITSAATPRLVFFLTDGDNYDKDEARKLLRQASKTPTFFVFVGVGSGRFDFLKSLDTLPGRLVDNATTLFYPDISKVPDPQLYGDVVKELHGWLQSARSLGLVNNHPETVMQDQGLMANLEKALSPPTPSPPPGSRQGRRFGLF